MQFDQETSLLKNIWNSKPRDFLKNYLVRGLHHPSIHMQSILTRHYLITKIFGTCFEKLKEDEIRFAIHWDELLQETGTEADFSLFQEKWKKVLSGRAAAKVSLLEIACGSANDYRFFHAYGLAPFLDYKGIDLSSSNIENAREIFPHIDFQEANLLNLNLPDSSFEYVMVHDLFEHFSPLSLEFSLSEACRLAKKGLVIAFFNMSDYAEHFFVPKKDYFWNELSKERTASLIHSLGFKVTCIDVAQWLADDYGYYGYHNFKAHTFFCEKA